MPKKIDGKQSDAEWLEGFIKTLRYLMQKDYDTMKSETTFNKKSYHKGRYDAIRIIIDSLEARMRIER